jgi:predicted metal-dependent HD superfamily phosphohydrolase
VTEEEAPPKFEIDPRYLWSMFVKRAGGDPQAADDSFAILTKLYNEPHRAYHTLAHIAWCLDLLREFFPERGPRPEWYDRVELALWFHDVIYDPKRKDNEERSANVLIGIAALLGLNTTLADTASLDVRYTTHKAYIPNLPLSTQWVLDLDLASLGFNPKRFDVNSDQIRDEYSFVPEDAYRAGRKVILQGFLDRPRIYLTEECFARFETQARENLKRAIERLG